MSFLENKNHWVGFTENVNTKMKTRKAGESSDAQTIRTTLFVIVETVFCNNLRVVKITKDIEILL